MLDTRTEEKVKKTPKTAVKFDLWSTVNEDPMTIIKLVREGVPGSALTDIAKAFDMPKSDIYTIFHVSPKTGQRLENKLLDKNKSDHLIQMAKVLNRAISIFKDKTNAMNWLKSPCFALGGQTPIGLLDTTEGTELVMNTLGRIEYGVFA